MGAGNSVPLWLNPNGNPSNYDMWGFVPDGMTPPQHVTSELYDLGFPQSSPLLSAQYDKTGQTDSATVLWGGQQNDVLATFGAGNTNALSTTNEYYPYSGSLTEPQFYSVSAPGKTWAPDSSSAAPTCNPANYPDCHLSSMRDAASVVTPWAAWWASVGRGAPADSYPWWQITPGASGKTINVMDRYLAKAEEHTRMFADGRYEGLKDVCSQDTSAYDPCSGSLFERVLPFLLGGAGLLVLRVYGSEALAFLPAQTNGYLYATTFLTLYHIGAGVEAVSLGDTGEWKDDTAAAANSLSMGIGAMVASYQLQGNTYVLPLSLAGAALSRMILSGMLYRALVPVVDGTGLLSAVPLLILRFFEKFFCWISNWGMTACDDFDENSGFPDARRWDVPSLASRLTDLACESEGWSRDSEQAKFVYRGLLLNPSWMTAATNQLNFAAGNTLWDGKRHVNPLGLVAPIHEFGGTKFDVSGKGSNVWDQRWSSDQCVFTGNEQGGAVNPIAETNRFACQNFDILFWGDECGQDDDPECQGTNPPARCQHQCAENPNQEGSDAALKNNMQTWLHELIASAYDPAKITAQFDIPGLDGSSFKYIPGHYDVATYLLTCANDFDGSGKTGFNDIVQRGNSANFYLSSKVYAHTALDETILVANNFFSAYGSLARAWDWVLHNWNRRNVTAYAHYVYREKGPIQQSSFDKWVNGFEEVRKWKDDPFHPNEGFTDNPRDGLKLFPPIIDKTHPGILHEHPTNPLHLQFPAQHEHMQPPLTLSPFLHESEPITQTVAELVALSKKQDWIGIQNLMVWSGYNGVPPNQGQWNHANMQQWFWGNIIIDAAFGPQYALQSIIATNCNQFHMQVPQPVKDAIFAAYQPGGDFDVIYDTRTPTHAQAVLRDPAKFAELFLMCDN